jgi:hypothetical protein
MTDKFFLIFWSTSVSRFSIQSIFAFKCTDALFNVLFFEVFAVEVVIKHALQICIVSLIAWAFIVNGVWEECVEAKTNEVGFTQLWIYKVGTSLLL